ncbi:MAG: hypothetical protein JSS29_01750 [Proteobacteria bacterium]|nr:hypothetical protein [Pseudomonadota bacterium]
MDGDEPFASVHLNVDADDAGSKSTIGKPRHDFDVSLSSDALAKRLDATPGLLTLLIAALLLFAINVLRGAMLPPAREQYLPSASFSRLRPPLRGPPLSASV